MNKDNLIKTLRKEIERLESENKSLWFMLDELKESNIANHQKQLKNSIEDQVENIKKERNKMPKKVGEA